LFLECYDKLQPSNTPNLICMPAVAVPWPELTPEQAGAIIYHEFFKNGIEDARYCTIFDGIGRDRQGTRNYAVHGKIYHDLQQLSEYGRLAGVHQLGTISHALMYFMLGHTRDDHSLRTAVMTELALRINGFAEPLVKLGIASGLLHDAAMSPYSDQGKSANRAELDEERLIGRLVRKRCVSSKLRAHGVKAKDVVSTVQGRGPLGDILNSSGIDTDNIAYLCMDYHMCWDLLPNALHAAMADIFTTFEDIRYADGKIYYSDAQRLMRLLEQRSIMYHEVYLNPLNRAKEAFLERELKPLWGTLLTLKNMTEMQDWQFRNLVEHKSPILEYIFRDTVHNHFYEISREYDLSQYGSLKKMQMDTCVVKSHPPSKSATRTLVEHQGKIVPVREVFAERCKSVEDTMRDLGYVGIYGFSKEPVELDTGEIYRSMDERIGAIVEGM
jgi:HD superfamily phosphohydrolase